jgi:hypothetical protein
VPESISIKCGAGAQGVCQIKGKGIEYISQVSVDDGKTWYPEAPAALLVEPAADGRSTAQIPRYAAAAKKSLQIRLRDFPSAEGLTIKTY